MLIYQIANPSQGKPHYVCDSQATIDAIPKEPQSGQPSVPPSLCSVGTQADADKILADNQQAWLTKQANIFTCNLQTTVEGGVVWNVVDLSTEPPNTDRQYFLLDPTTGLYTEAIGLEPAKTLLAQIQQNYLIFSNLSTYKTLTEWPPVQSA